MEEIQKNENGTTVPQADGKPKKEDKPKRELTPQQVQQRRKMIVFPLMFLAFAGCMYLILWKAWAASTPIYPCPQRTGL